MSISLIWMRRGRLFENTVPATLRVCFPSGHGQLDVAFIGALLVAAHFRYTDAALLGDDRRVDHVDFRQRRLQQAGQQRLHQRARVQACNRAVKDDFDRIDARVGQLPRKRAELLRERNPRPHARALPRPRSDGMLSALVTAPVRR